MKIPVYNTLCLGTILVALDRAILTTRADFLRGADSSVDLFNALLRDGLLPTQLEKLPEFDGLATNSQTEMSAFSRKYRLPEIRVSPSSMVAIGYFKLLSSWLVAGTVNSVELAGGRWRYARMRAKSFTEYGNPRFDVLFGLKAKGGFTVYLGSPTATMLSKLANPAFLLAFTALPIQLDKKAIKGYTVLEFPELSIEEQRPLRMLLGTSIGKDNPITDALQINNVSLTHTGVEVGSYTEIRSKSAERSFAYRFEQPFLVWVTHVNTGEHPLFVAWATKDSWTQVA